VVLAIPEFCQDMNPSIRDFESNHPAAGKAGIVHQFEIGRCYAGLPEPGRCL
jgi:hypothetical protein